MRLGDPRPIDGRQQETVVRADVQPALGVAQRQRLVDGRRPRVDDREMNPDRHVGQRVGEHERALQHRLRRDPVRDVDDLGLRRDALDHSVTGADEVVLEAEVGEEGDEHVPAPSLRRRGASVRSVAGQLGDRRGDAAARVVLGLRHDPKAGRLCRPGRLGADRDDRQLTPESAERPRRGRRRDDVEIGRRKLAPGSTRGSDTERRRPPQACPATGVRAPSPAANSTRPAGRGNSASNPSCVATRVRGRPPREPQRSPHRSPRPAASHRSPARRSSRAPLALVTTTQSYPDTSIGASPSGLDRDQRTMDDLVAEHFQPGDEIVPPAPPAE